MLGSVNVSEIEAKQSRAKERVTSLIPEDPPYRVCEAVLCDAVYTTGVVMTTMKRGYTIEQ